MPPKVKITREDIINATLNLVREQGVDAINARAIAAALNCSTQPLFSNFESMEDLQNAVVNTSYERYTEFIKRELENGKYPPYKAYGIAYIRFAREERELFKLLFMCDRSDADLSPSEDFEQVVSLIMETNGISYDRAMLFHLEMWSAVHGIATMHATRFLKLEWELISNIISDIYNGIRIKHLSEENNDGSN